MFLIRSVFNCECDFGVSLTSFVRRRCTSAVIAVTIDLIFVMIIFVIVIAVVVVVIVVVAFGRLLNNVDVNERPTKRSGSRVNLYNAKLSFATGLICVWR